MSGPVVLLTGGGSGLGLGMARRLAGRGMRVLATIRTAEPPPGDDAGIVWLQADMRDHKALARLVEDAAATHERLDALVCNAAVQGFAALGDIEPHDWQEVLDVNVTAPLFLAQAAAPHLAATHGLILMISSVHAARAAPSRLMYAASKAALEAMARNLAVELALGPFASPALAAGAARFFPGRPAEEALRAFATRQPLGRVGDADELGDLVAFLMSAPAGFVTGTTITVDGGQTTRLAVPELGA